MKVFNKKRKGSIVMMVVLAMLLQIVGPVVETVYAVPTNGDLIVSVTNDFNGVLGKSKTVTVNLENSSDDWIFNVGLEVELGSGLELDNKSEIAPNSTTVDGETQKLSWKDIKDLAPKEKFSFTFEVKIRETHRGKVEGDQEVDVNFGENVEGNVTVVGSNDPQTFDNLTSLAKTFNFKVVPFEVILSEGGKLLKGAGSTIENTDDKYWKEMKITIINNTKYPATIDLANTIANGVQVTDSNGQYIPHDTTDGKSTLQWDKVNVTKGNTSKITYKVAIFDKYTNNGAVNTGDFIDDGTSLPITLNYSGTISLDSTVYTGDTSRNLIAKDIILDKSISYLTPISYGTEFIYLLKATVNQYHDIGDIILTDILGDGQEYQESYNNNLGYTIKTESFNVTNYEVENLEQGKTKLKWPISNIENGGQFKKGESYSLDFKAKVKENWFNSNDIVAGDSFVNNATITGKNMGTNATINSSDTDSVHTHIPLPTINKKVTHVNNVEYNGGNGSVQANIGDIVRFEVTYDASFIGVKQKDVEIVDIFPQGTEVNLGSISYTLGDAGLWNSGWSDGKHSNIISDPNVLRWKFKELAKNTKLTVQYEATVKNIPENTNAKQTFNLAKMAVKNTANIIQSKRDQVEIKYTEPILSIEKTADKTKDLKGGEKVTFTITINNTGLGTAYGVKVSDLLPAELEKPELVAQTGVDMTPSDKTLKFTLGNPIPARGSAEIKYKATVIGGIGNLRGFTNKAEIEEYKNRTDGSDKTRTYNKDLPSTSVTMEAAKPTITMEVVSPKTTYKVGDWVIYKVDVTIPANTTAYNGYVEVDIDENQNVLFVSKDSNPSEGNKITISDATTGGYDKKWVMIEEDYKNNTNNNKLITYYIKTTIKGPKTPNASEVQKGKAIFTWDDKASEGIQHNTEKTPDVSVEVKLPQLITTISTDRANIVKDEEVLVTFTVTNNGGNTAYNFTPTVVVPAGFTISDISDSGNYTGDIANGGTITFPAVTNLEPGDSAKLTYTFKAKLDVLQPAGSSKQFVGHSGVYYTNVDVTVPELQSISSTATVKMPSVGIVQAIDSHTNGPNNYIRPGDTVDYRITVTVPKGTIAYDLEIEDTLPADFELVAGGEDAWTLSSDKKKATITLGIVDASSTEQVIIKTIKLKAKTDSTYGAYKTETNKVQANWKSSAGGTSLPATTADVSINVREPNLTLQDITATKTEFNNTTQEITLTIPVQNNRNTPAYNGSFRLELPPEFEVATGEGSINNSGVYNGSDDKHEVTWSGVGISNNTTQNFVVKLKLKSNGSAGAGKQGIPVKFTIISYESKENTEPLPVKEYKPNSSKDIKLSIAPVTISKVVNSTTSTRSDYVRPGDTIIYKVDIVVPNNTTAYGLSFKDVLEVEQELVSIKSWNDVDITTSSNNTFHDFSNVTSGTYTITVTSKVKTDASYNAIEYGYSNTGYIEWNDSGSGGIKKIANSSIKGKVRQPSIGLTVSSPNSISTPTDNSKITVTLSNTGGTPAYNLKIEVEIPAGIKVKDGSISNGGTLSGDGRKIVWENILEFSNTVIPDISFNVEQDKNVKANTGLEIKATLKEYGNKQNDESSKKYSEVTNTTTVNLIGSHTLSKATPKEQTGIAGKTLTFTHTLTNTGAGTDTYTLTKAGDYTATIKVMDEDSNILTEVTEITLNAGSSIELTYEITIPTSAPKGEEKTHTITSTSISEINQTNSQNDKVTVVGINYNGTTFDGITAPTNGSDWQNGWTQQTFAPGQLIELKALTSHDITSVVAKIKVAGDGGGYIDGTDTNPIPLGKTSNGKWEESYKLPDTLSTGEYFIEYYSYNNLATLDLQDKDNESSAMATNNYFTVAKPDLSISLTPEESTVVSSDRVTFTLRVDNSKGLTDAYGVIPKVTLPDGVEFVSVTDAVYGTYKLNDKVLEFYVSEKKGYTLTTGSSGTISIEFTVQTNSDLSADEILNFPATTGAYYTAIDKYGNPIIGTKQEEKETSALLKTETITFAKEVLGTTNGEKDFVRPGDQIIYQINVGIPEGLSIYNLKLEDIVGDTLEIEKVVVNGVEYPASETTWTSNLTGTNKSLEILVYTKVKDDMATNEFTTKSTANISWESKYRDFKGEDKKEITINGKRPRVSLESFTSDKTTITEPNETLAFTGKIKNNGTGTAHKTKIVAKLPNGVVPVEGSYGSGIYDEDANTITWVYDLSKGEEKTTIFQIKADGNKPVQSGSKVVFDLEEYFSTEDEVYTTKYDGEEKDIGINATGDHAITNKYDEEVLAGSTVELIHVLTNKGGSQDTFTITVDSLFPVEFGSNTISLAPGESKEIKIIVQIPSTESKNVDDDKHTITLTAKGKNSDKSHNAQNTIKVIGEDLDGWVSNSLWAKWNKENYKDEWKETTYYLGSPLKPSAITSIDIANVKAEIYKLDESNSKGKMVKQLELKEYTDFETEGKFKLWDNTDFILENLESGRYFVEFKAYKDGSTIEEDVALTTESTELGYNNYFSVKSKIDLKGTIKDAREKTPIEGAVVRLLDLKGNLVKDSDGQEYTATVGADGKYKFPNVQINQYILEVKHNKYKEYSQNIYVIPETSNGEVTIDVELIGFTIELKANPSTIVGDGKSLTVLTTKVLDEDGKPVKDVEVVFNAPIGKLLGEPNDPKNPNINDIKSKEVKSMTNENGEAYMLYQSEKIEGIVSQIIPVAATVDDKVRELYGIDSIYITFEPASINGIVKDNKTGKPIEGAKVVVTKTFEDGTTFYGEAITGSDGKYKIAIPKGNMTYDVEITKPIELNGETVDITFNQKAQAKEVSADKKDEEFPATKTFTGLIIINDENGTEKIAGKGEENTIKIKVLEDDGTTSQSDEVVNKDTGVFTIEGLEKNKEYKFVIVTEVDGKELLMGQMVVTLDDDGEISIHEELIDPYGTIRDAETNNVLGDVHVQIFYADTPRNKGKGITPNTTVALPEILGFAPNNNINPQWSKSTLVFNDHPDVNDHGNYAWMVFPETDYYIVGTKSGYETYKSETISVEFDVVKHDFKMKPIKSSDGGGGGSGGITPIPIKPDNTPIDAEVDITIDQRNYLEETDGQLEIDYSGKTGNPKDVELVVTIPKGAVVVDTDGGTIVGDTIVWKIGDLKDGQGGTKKPKIKLPKISSSEETTHLKAEIMSNGKLLDTSTLNITVFSNRFGNKEHSRYIQGYPDGEFKPDRSITRGEIAVIFARILRLEDLVKNEEMYKDVKLDSWYARGVEAATRKGLFEGYNDGNFRPNQPITRGELATVIARFLELPNSPPVNQVFKDTTNHWALNYIAELYRNNVITGYTDGTFKPQAQLKRSEAVTMINRMLNRGPLKGVEPSFPDVNKDHWAVGDVEESTRSHQHYRNSDGSETHIKTIHEMLNF